MSYSRVSVALTIVDVLPERQSWHVLNGCLIRSTVMVVLIFVLPEGSTVVALSLLGVFIRSTVVVVLGFVLPERNTVVARPLCVSYQKYSCGSIDLCLTNGMYSRGIGVCRCFIRGVVVTLTFVGVLPEGQS